ncbi:MAG: hypothetical protein JNM55_19350 [Anaerolineales bacterium]|nr:hypothetical protein [Anaerolineales bacterium]
MKKLLKRSTLCLILIAIAVGIGSLSVQQVVDEQFYGEILNVYYDQSNTSLRLDFVGGESETIILDPNALKIEIFEIQNPSAHVYLRFFSPAFYESYGQTRQSIAILTRMNPADITSEFENRIAADFPIAVQPTKSDLSFAVLHYYFWRHNKVDKKRPVCTSNNANELLNGIASSSCYIVCQGKVEVMTHFLAPSTRRIVSLWSRRDDLDGGFIFLASELHTTLEIFDNNKWYVADPTFGFAYVENAAGVRLDTKELIAALEKQKMSELTFGLVSSGVIHEVPGDLVLKTNKTMAGIYYTPDKQLEYREIDE